MCEGGERNGSANGSADAPWSPIRAPLRGSCPPPSSTHLRRLVATQLGVFVAQADFFSLKEARSRTDAAGQTHLCAEQQADPEPDCGGPKAPREDGNPSPAVMSAHSERISLVCCQKHLERITEGYTPPPEDRRIIHIPDISAGISSSLCFNVKLV